MGTEGTSERKYVCLCSNWLKNRSERTFALALCPSHPVQLLPITAIVHQRAEESIFILKEICRGIEFDEVTSVENNDPIAVPNCLQAMRYSDYGHVFKFTSYRGLDQSIGVVVDSCSGYKGVIRRSDDP